MNIRTIMITAGVFGVVGPAIGAVVVWLQQPPTTFNTVRLLVKQHSFRPR